LFLSGGNFALLKELCRICHEQDEQILTHPNYLMQQPGIQSILQQIESFMFSKSIFQLLGQGIINNNGTLFSLLLQKYLQNNESNLIKRLFPHLSKTDQTLLSIFVNNPNKVIDKEQIALVLEQTADSDAGWAIYKAVERFKKKVKDSYPINTRKGLGWVYTAV